MVNPIRTPMLIQGKLERKETNLMRFKWEVTLTHGNQHITFKMGQRVNSHFVFNNYASIHQIGGLNERKSLKN